MKSVVAPRALRLLRPVATASSFLADLSSQAAGSDVLASALSHAQQLGNPELTAMMKELAGELGGEPCVPDLAVAILSNVCLERNAKAAVQQGDVVAALQKRLQEPLAAERVAGLVGNLVGTDAAGSAMA